MSMRATSHSSQLKVEFIFSYKSSISWVCYIIMFPSVTVEGDFYDDESAADDESADDESSDDESYDDESSDDESADYESADDESANESDE